MKNWYMNSVMPQCIRICNKCCLFYRVSLKLNCPMQLKNYPFDRQTCSIEMESCKYTIFLPCIGWIDYFKKTLNHICVCQMIEPSSEYFSKLTCYLLLFLFLSNCFVLIFIFIHNKLNYHSLSPLRFRCNCIIFTD